MAADATIILNAFVTGLQALFPNIPVFQSKRPATDGKNLECGWQAGYPSTCFIVSALEPEEVDKNPPSFTQVPVGYPLAVEYIKPANAVISNAPNTGNPTVVEDSDIRDKRQALRRQFYKPTLAGTPVYDVHHRNRPVYEKVIDAALTLVVSGEIFTYVVAESRQH